MDILFLVAILGVHACCGMTYSHDPALQKSYTTAQGRPPWLGADGATPVTIAPGITAVLYGDTLRGTFSAPNRRHVADMIHNSIGIAFKEQGGEISFFSIQLFNDSVDRKAYEWPTAAAMHHGTLYVSAYVIVPSSGPFGFTTNCSRFYAIDAPGPDPALWPAGMQSYVPAQTNTQLQLSAAFLSGALFGDSHHLYAIGIANQSGSDGNVNFVARSSDMLSFDFFDTTQGWQSEAFSDMFQGVVPAATEVGWQFCAAEHVFYIVTLDFFCGNVVILTASDVEGPYQSITRIFDPTPLFDTSRYFWYSPKFQPWMSPSSPVSYVVSFNVNAYDFGDLDNATMYSRPLTYRYTPYVLSCNQ